MTEREELEALRRIAYLEAKAKGTHAASDGSVVGPRGQIVYDAANDPTNNLSPVDGMSGLEKFGAGLGHRAAATGQGIAQIFGNPNQAAIDEKAKLDAPLLRTGAGRAGDIAGGVAETLPAMLIPGVNTYAGAAMLGGGMGLTDPVTSSEGNVALGKLENVGKGALMGGAGQLAGNLLGATVRGAKAAVAPLFQWGQNEIANAALQRIAHDPAAAAVAADTYRAAVPGVNPTLAEATLDPGISQLQRSMAGKPGADIAAQHVANRNALLDAIRGIAKSPQDMQVAERTRAAMSDPFYAAADAATVSPDAQFAELLKRPVVADAMRVVSENMANRGGTMATPNGQMTGATLHELKMALDGMLETAPQRGIGTSSAKAIKSARDDVLQWIENAVPDYAQARQSFAAGSRPINQMEVGQQLYDTLVPALSQASGTSTRLAPAAYARALQDTSGKLARDATGFSGATLESVMDPSQLATLRGVGADLGRESAAYDSAMTRGSPTGQNFATQNMIDQISGSLGGGPRVQALARAMLRYPMRGFDLLTHPMDEEIKAKIAERLMDPSQGAVALRYQPGTSRTDALADALRRLATPAIGAAYATQE